MMLTFILAAIAVVLLFTGAILVDLCIRRGIALQALNQDRDRLNSEIDSVTMFWLRNKRRAEDLQKEYDAVKEAHRECYEMLCAAESRLALALLEEKRLRKRCETLAKPHRDKVIFLDDLIES